MPHPLQHLLAPLQHSPGLRSALYLGAAAAQIQMIGGWLCRDDSSGNHAVLPPGTVLTAAGLWLDGRSPRELLSSAHDRHQLAQGALAGTVAALALQAALRATGWATVPQWGWEERPAGDVLRAVALTTVGHRAVAWNEEQVFRGYGYDCLHAALGPAGAGAVLVPLFAAFHPLRPAVLVVQGLAGLLLLGMRVETGAIWFGVSYHWAWNTMQTAIFGPAEGEALPSLRPLRVHGPVRWVGAPRARAAGRPSHAGRADSTRRAVVLGAV